ncbi:hypothetical protein [Nonomuraea sp. NPDC046570]|uniref:hypothetical protein n=1 Tax=Nonomuraea sp. NPDC046570 TaxID=3155255 RepID=UPI0033E0AE38
MKFNSRGIAVTIAALALAGLTSACGSSSAAACADVNAEVTKLVSEYSANATKNMTDLKAFEEANKKMAEGLKGIAAKHDGDLASAINDLAAVYDGLKIDAADPAKSAAALTDIGTKSQEITAKMAKACA